MSSDLATGSALTLKTIVSTVLRVWITQGYLSRNKSRLFQVDVAPHACAAVLRREPQMQAVIAEDHIVTRPAIRWRPHRAVLWAVNAPCARACMVGDIDCAAVSVELLGSAAFKGEYPGG